MLCFMHNLLYRICSCPWRHSQLEPLGIIHILRNMHILSLLLYMNHICKISYIVFPSRTLTPSTSSYTYIQKWINMYVCMCIYTYIYMYVCIYIWYMYIDILIYPQVYSTHISCARYFVYEFKHVKSHMSLPVPVPTLKLFLYTHT